MEEQDSEVAEMGKQIRVPAEHPSIQSAIDAADAGSRIILAPGVYEEVITIKKQLELTGEGDRKRVVLQGASGDAVLEVPPEGAIGACVRGQASSEHARPPYLCAAARQRPGAEPDDRPSRT